MSPVSSSPRLPVRMRTEVAQWCSKRSLDDKKCLSEGKVLGRCICCDTKWKRELQVCRVVAIMATRSDCGRMRSSGQKTRASQMQIDGECDVRDRVAEVSWRKV